MTSHEGHTGVAVAAADTAAETDAVAADTDPDIRSLASKLRDILFFVFLYYTFRLVRSS